METSGQRISNLQKMCALMMGYLMWGLVYKNPLAARVFYAALRLLRRDSASIKAVLGQKLYVNPYRSIVQLRLDLCGMYEPEVVEYLLSRLSPGMTVIDIGANIGFFTLLAADLVGPSGKVVCYEPVPETFNQLRQNIALNQYTNIIPVQSALSNTGGVGRMTVRMDSALNRFAVAAVEPTVEVCIETLDESLRGLSVYECDLIKMDIEGAEILAVQGMGETIARNPRLEFVIEVHPSKIKELGGTVEQFVQFFLIRAFRLFRLDMWKGLTPISLTESGTISGHIVCKRIPGE